MISKEEVQNMASLAKLRISEDQLDEFTNKLSGIKEYVSILEEVDTEGVEALYQVYDYKQVLREDTVEDSLPREEVLKNTQEKQYGYFKLFNIMDE